MQGRCGGKSSAGKTEETENTRRMLNNFQVLPKTTVYSNSNSIDYLTFKVLTHKVK